jgi:hypothetical protein
MVISSEIWASQAKTAKQSHWWEAVRRPIPHGEWKDLVCFEKGARMDSFAAVLPKHGYSSMYEAMCVKEQSRIYK